MSMLIASAERTLPSRVVGKTVEGVTSVYDALKMAGLDGEVKVSENQVAADVLTDSGVTRVEAEGKFLTYRTMPNSEVHSLGVVGSRYVPIQDTDAFDFLNALVDESGSTFDSVGTLSGGKQSILTIKLPESLYIAGHDQIDMYLMAKNSHDGSSSFTVAVTPIRLRCLNQVNKAFKTAPMKMSMRHTFGSGEKIAQARETLGLIFKYQVALQNEFESLLAQEYLDNQFRELVKNLFPIGEEAKQPHITRVKATRGELIALWNAPTQEGIKGTKWGAYNAVVEYADWYSPVRGKREASLIRAERVLSGAGEAIKEKVLALL